MCGGPAATEQRATPPPSTRIAVSCLAAESLDDATVQRLVTLVGDAYARHSWLIPDSRSRPNQLREETAGKHLLLAHDIVGSNPLAEPQHAASPAASPEPAPSLASPSSPNALATPSSLVGVAVISTRADALYLEMVAVAPEAQGRGIAAHIITAAVAEARHRHLAKLALNTFRELGNEAYWRRHSFHLIAEDPQPQGTLGSTAPFTIVHMELPLPPLPSTTSQG